MYGLIGIGAEWAQSHLPCIAKGYRRHYGSKALAINVHGDALARHISVDDCLIWMLRIQVRFTKPFSNLVEPRREVPNEVCNERNARITT